MKHLILAISFILAGPMAWACTSPTSGPGKLSGPTTVCGGATETYTLGNGINICFISAAFQASGGQVISGGSTTGTPHTLQVRWNNVTTTTGGRVDYSQQYQSGNCVVGAPSALSNKSYNVTIRPNPASLARPAAISRQVQQTNYVYSTSSPDAASFEWQVTSGGTIIGSTTGSSITVSASSGSCQINVRVRGVNTRCDGTTLRSSYRTFTDNLTPPGRPTTPFGPQYVGRANFSKSYGTSNATATSFRWYVQGSTFEIVGDNSRGTATVRCLTDASTATTLYVRAVNSCGESDAAFKTITGGITPPFGGTGSRGAEELDLSEFIEDLTATVYPNPIDRNTGILHLEVPAADKVLELRVINLAGQVIKELNPNTEIDLDVTLWEPGMYLLQAVRQHETTTTKFAVE
ncbi:MAG: T9SS type A sorting domain-containing protein [Bacteroidota bacterium]